MKYLLLISLSCIILQEGELSKGLFIVMNGTVHLSRRICPKDIVNDNFLLPSMRNEQVSRRYSHQLLLAFDWCMLHFVGTSFPRSCRPGKPGARCSFWRRVFTPQVSAEWVWNIVCAGYCLSYHCTYNSEENRSNNYNNSATATEACQLIFISACDVAVLCPYTVDKILEVRPLLQSFSLPYWHEY